MSTMLVTLTHKELCKLLNVPENAVFEFSSGSAFEVDKTEITNTNKSTLEVRYVEKP